MNTPRVILDLNNYETATDEDVARDISNKLYEEKDTLLRKFEIICRLLFKSKTYLKLVVKYKLRLW